MGARRGCDGAGAGLVDMHTFAGFTNTALRLVKPHPRARGFAESAIATSPAGPCDGSTST
jgi:hypothetical protein